MEGDPNADCRSEPDPHMLTPILYSPLAATLLVASAETPHDADAMMRWLAPLLTPSPRQTWAAWLIDAENCAHVRVATYGHDGRPARWRFMEGADFLRHGDGWRPLAGRAGLVLLVEPKAAPELARQLDGLAGTIVEIDAHSQAAGPFRPQVPALASAA